MHRLIAERRDEIAALCRRYGVQRLEVFGSAARGGDFNATLSDADFLVQFAPGEAAGADNFVAVKGALERALGRRVDLVERGVIERSRNYIRRRRILGDAEPVYVA
jgi:predicted nucleotidyltransferase